MITRITPLNTSFCADKKTINVDGEYRDPLMRWPLRGAAFTNEVGEALRPIIGEYATLSWVPALMYIGADIYDKYKNNNTEYSPNSKRCLKQAIFQGMASIFLPLVAVKAGQKVFSQFGKLSEDKITINSKEHIARIAQEFIANGKMHAFDGKDEECVKDFLDRVSNKMDFKHRKKLFRIFHIDKKENITRYAENTIKDLIKLRKELLNPTNKIKTGNWYSYFVKSLKNNQTENVAIKSVLSKFQKHKMIKGKFIKTIGGFAALGIAIKPIDNFVENVLIGKYVGPGIDNFKK